MTRHSPKPRKQHKAARPAQQDSSLNETLYLLSTPANARALHRAIAQDREGQAQPRQLIDTP